MADVKATIDSLSITMTSEFVPWSKSRNAGDKQPSLNWRVTMLHEGKPFLTTDYMAGCGHCPSYKQGDNSVDYWETIKRECERGRAMPSATQVIKPKFEDVLHSLVSDSEALDYANFEDWADNYGYDKDSRKAEATYHSCLDVALKMRNAIGESGLAQLREAFSDY